MRTGVFISLLILALTGYGLYHFFSQPKPPFNPPLLNIRPGEVTSLLISMPGGSNEITLLRESNGWIASNGQINIKASSNIIQDLITALANVTVHEVVATERKFWKVYGVDAAQGIRIRLYADKTLLEDFIIGKLDTDPSTQLPISYLRLLSGEEVYAVPGKLALDFNRDFKNFRNPLILQINNPSDIAEIELETPDTIFQYIRTPEGWKSESTFLDTLQMERYLQTLREIHSDSFADDFDEVAGSKYLYQILTIKNKTNTEPFIITCYRDTTRNPPFIIQSSQNKEAFFASDSLGIYHTIFGKVNNWHKNVKRDTTAQR
ncbi:MAG: DUF4340 domain-containing protein [Saprospiraceae bacterium]